MASKKTTQSSRYKKLRKLQNGGNDLNAYYQNLYNTENRYDQFNLGTDQFSTPQDQESSFDLNSGTVGALGTATQILGGLTEGYGTEGYEAQFGEHSSLTADIASQVGPIGALASGVGETLGNVLKSGIDYNEYGVAQNEANQELYYQAGALFDPAGSAQYFAEKGEYGTALGSLLLPGLGGTKIAEQEQEEAKAREQEVFSRQRTIESRQIAQERGVNLGANPNIQTGDVQYAESKDPNFLNYFGFQNGGYLPKKQTGGIINNPDLSKVVNDLTYSTSTISDPQALIRNANLGYKTSRSNPSYTEGQLTRYPSKTYITPSRTGYNVTPDSTAGSLPVDYYVPFTDKLSGQVRQTPLVSKDIFNEYFPDSIKSEIPSGYKDLGTFQNGGQIRNSNKTIINSYKGNTHEDSTGGIPVDSNGIPSAQSRRNPIALTEDGEISWDSYIFSNSF